MAKKIKTIFINLSENRANFMKNHKKYKTIENLPTESDFNSDNKMFLSKSQEKSNKTNNKFNLDSINSNSNKNKNEIYYNKFKNRVINQFHNDVTFKSKTKKSKTKKRQKLKMEDAYEYQRKKKEK